MIGTRWAALHVCQCRTLTQNPGQKKAAKFTLVNETPFKNYCIFEQASKQALTRAWMMN